MGAVAANEVAKSSRACRGAIDDVEANVDDDACARQLGTVEVGAVALELEFIVEERCRRVSC